MIIAASSIPIASAIAQSASAVAVTAAGTNQASTGTSWPIILPFVGGMLGGLIFSPLLELLKDRIGAQRAWLKQRTEIVQTIRLVLGLFSGFLDLADNAYGTKAKYFPERAKPYVKLLQTYELSIAKNRIARLAELHPRDSQTSGISQQLIAIFTATFAALLAVQKMQPRLGIPDPTLPKSMQASILNADDEIIYKVAIESNRQLIIYLGGVFARRLELDPFSLMADPEVTAFNREIVKILHIPGNDSKA